MTDQQPGPEHVVPPQQPAEPAAPTGSVPTDGPPPSVVPLPALLTTYRKPVIAAGGALAVLLAAVAVVGIYQGVKEDSGVAACREMAEMAAANKQSEGPEEDRKLQQRLREQFADSDNEKIREHGTALVDISIQLSKLSDGNSHLGTQLIEPMTRHGLGLQTACANEGVDVDLFSD